ncbi:MAG: TIGR02186 family protein [Alphaproteobacteria bacterium]
MRISIRFILILLFLLPKQSFALPLVAELGTDNIYIDHKFNGIEVLLIGARNENGRITIITRGEEKNFLVRKKERVKGVWVNNDSIKIYNAPNYYKIASSGKMGVNQNNPLLKNLEISIDNLNFLNTKNDYLKTFLQAFVEEKQQKNLYSAQVDRVQLIGETLFRDTIKFPKNISPGLYTTEIYLINGDELSSLQIVPINIKKVGFDAVIERFADNYSYLYGLLAVGLAILLGFVAFKLLV